MRDPRALLPSISTLVKRIGEYRQLTSTAASHATRADAHRNNFRCQTSIRYWAAAMASSF
jgi:hypothetical protein